jgi:hypothetical protein
MRLTAVLITEWSLGSLARKTIILGTPGTSDGTSDFYYYYYFGRAEEIAKSLDADGGVVGVGVCWVTLKNFWFEQPILLYG